MGTPEQLMLITLSRTIRTRRVRRRSRLPITGTNDAPVATFTTAQAATEDAAAISGQLTSTDADTTAQVNATTAEYSLVGDAISGLTLNTDGSWSFDASGTAYQDLSEWRHPSN